MSKAKKILWLIGLLSLIIAMTLIAGCSNAPLADETAIPNTPAEVTRPVEATTPLAPDGDPGDIDPGLKPLIDIAREDLAERLDIPLEQITVLEAKLVEWPDASLGCPQPDTVYIQVPMDGSIILFQAGGETYQYHTGGDVQVFLCEDPSDDILGRPKSGDEFIPAPGIGD
jgi:hypothetical protein